MLNTKCPEKLSNSWIWCCINSQMPVGVNFVWYNVNLIVIRMLYFSISVFKRFDYNVAEECTFSI